MAHNRRKQRIEDAFEPQLKEEMLQAFWEATNTADLEAWFSEPWNDGRNAVELCLAFEARLTPAHDPLGWLRRIIGKDHSSLTSEDYTIAEDLKYEISRTNATRYGVLLNAALAIYANWIARSDGGGHVPNIHLSSAFGQVLYSGEVDVHAVHAAVGLWRARDAQVPWNRIGDGSDEGQRAATHRWLWMNRRYQMANVFARVR